MIKLIFIVTLAFLASLGFFDVCHYIIGLVQGSNSTNSTNEMLFGDNWYCGYITNTTTLYDIRNCFRD